MSVHFQAPPINELVIAVNFTPPLFALRSEHIGLFWKIIREEFPKVEQKSTIDDTVLYGSGEVSSFPMPRYWFVSKDGNVVLQVQKNAFILNWRSHGSDYPRFEKHIKPMFDRYIAIFLNFIDEESIQSAPEIDLCELSYSNLIKICDYWSGPADTSLVIPSFCFPGLNDRKDVHSFSECRYAARLDAKRLLQVAIREGGFIENPDEPVLSFDITVGGSPGNSSAKEVNAWFDCAHDTAVAHFLSMTSVAIQNEHWGRKEI